MTFKIPFWTSVRQSIVKDFGTPNHFFVYLLIKRSIVSTFVIDTHCYKPAFTGTVIADT